MAIIERDNFKTVEGNISLSLSPRSGEAAIVRDVMIYNPASNYVTLKVSQYTVGYFRVGGSLGNHLPFPIQDEENASLLAYLREVGLFEGYPVREGETFDISGAAQSGAVQVVRYDRVTPDEAENFPQNGIQSPRLLFVNYGRPTSSVADGSNDVNDPQNPNEFIKFPFGSRVPENRRVTIHGILASDVGKTSGTGANKQYTQYLALSKDGQFLFDVSDLNGIPIVGIPPSSDSTDYGTGSSVIGNYTDVDRRLPFLFPEPLTFVGGDLLEVKIVTNVSAGSANLSVSDCEVGFIMSVERET